jgi:hypothetical protein
VGGEIFGRRAEVAGAAVDSARVELLFGHLAEGVDVGVEYEAPLAFFRRGDGG